MKSSRVETAVGIFVLIGLLCIGYLTIKLGQMELIGSGNHYTVYARFQDATGLKQGVSVEVAGVPVGKVDEITLDREREVALVKMLVQKSITLTDDTIAAIKTSGLIGDKYIKLIPGGSPMDLEPGGTLTETESAIDVESLISKYVFGSVGTPKEEEEKK